MNTKIFTFVVAVLSASAFAIQKSAPPLAGDYLEVRSCDVYTGSCFANSEMGLAGKECILSWNVKNGAWNGVDVSGLKVIAVVRADATLGDLRYQPRSGKAVLVVDAAATPAQSAALQSMAREFSGQLIREVAEVRTSPISMTVGTCASGSCGKVNAGNLIEISTRCFGDKDHVCGNEDTFYPPLLKVDHAVPAFTEVAAFRGTGLNMTWEAVGQRSAFLAKFSR